MVKTIIKNTGNIYTAGNGLDLTETSFSVDLKGNGGLVHDSTEITVDLGASGITGTLALGDGGTGATTAGASRTALGVDAAGTDNSTAVTLANTNYLTLSGQAITGGTVPVASGGTGATSAADARTNLGAAQNANDASVLFGRVHLGSNAVSVTTTEAPITILCSTDGGGGIKKGHVVNHAGGGNNMRVQKYTTQSSDHDNLLGIARANEGGGLVDVQIGGLMYALLTNQDAGGVAPVVGHLCSVASDGTLVSINNTSGEIDGRTADATTLFLICHRDAGADFDLNGGAGSTHYKALVTWVKGSVF